MTLASLGIAVSSNADKAAVDLDKLVAASGRAEAGAERLVVASKNAARATSQMGLNTANIAAQIQDIVVSTQMGMNGLQVGLQQGTQLAAALGNQGLKGTVTALGSAFASVLSPVSLLTIGVVGLGTAGVQWLMNMNQEAGGVEDSLKRHNEWLDKILHGYDDARKAADRYSEEAMKLPQGAVQSDIAARAEESLKRYQGLLAQVKNEQTAFLADYIGAYASAAERDPAIRMAEELQRLQAQLSLSNPDLDGLITRLTEIKNSDAYEIVRLTAEKMLNLALEAKGAKDEVEGLNASLNNLPDSVQVKLQLSMDNFMSAQKDLRDLMPDFRNRFDRMRDEATAAYNRQIGSASDEILRATARSDYDKVLAGIDRLQKEEAARKSASAGLKAGDAYQPMRRGAKCAIRALNAQVHQAAKGAF